MADETLDRINAAVRRAISRRRFLTRSALGLAAAGFGSAAAQAQAPQLGRPSAAAARGAAAPDVALVNGKIYTMDGTRRVVSQALIQNGRFTAVGTINAPRGIRTIDLKGHTVVPGLIDAHNHIVLVGNRPGRHVLLEDVFTLSDVVKRFQSAVADSAQGEFLTTVGPIASMQFPEQRLPTLTELDAVNRPVYINASQGGVRTNSLGKSWLESRGVMMIGADGTVPGGATGATLALKLLREQQLTMESRKRNAIAALGYYAGLGITTHLDNGAFQSDAPSGGVANENTYTMHNPFLALNAEKRLPARLRFNYLHQDPPNDPSLPTLAPRLKNSLPFFGDDWMRSGGIGEFTGGGVNGLRAIAAAGWRAEDHTLNLASFKALVESREAVHAEIPITNLRWVISHVPQVDVEHVNRFKAMGGGLLVGWGPLRTGMKVGPEYRMLIGNGIPLGYHSDGGDITAISPWLNFYTMITGRNLKGDLINEGQTLTRMETLWLATAANKWFIEEDDLGSIEVGNHADLAVLDRDYFTVPDEDLKHLRSILTIVGGKVVHDARAL